ncbi:MAG TPA: hypothetical protein VFW46_23320, partial [Stellaceae bacterium]|nr:hypothetical protein [Stellaceae bacterium]
MNVQVDNFLAPRRCMREPINEIFRAAQLLDQATEAHLAGEFSTAKTLVEAAEMPQCEPGPNP